MKKQEAVPVPAIGGSSLLVIFGVLCLVILSLLALNTALAEKRLSETYAGLTEDWYAADLEAQEIFARLRNGEKVPGVERKADQYRYSVPVSGHQTLQVTVKETEGCWEVLSWQAIAHPEDGETTLPVWQGTEEEGSHD